ncbi:MAG: tetratricopeptide repeat protein, partial [Pseudomonadota bacterium]
LLGFLALIVLSLWLLKGMQRGVEPVLPASAPLPVSAVPAIEPAAPRLLEVLPQHDSRGLVLQLLLERSVAYGRSEESGIVSLSLPGVRLAGEAQHGRLQRDGQSLSWRVESRGADVQVQLVGLGDNLQVHDRLEAAGDRWLLWIEVPLAATDGPAEVDLNLDALPRAEPALEPETPMPRWLSAPVPAAEARVPEAMMPVAAPPAPVATVPQMKIASHRPDALAQARGALDTGDFARAIVELETLHKARGNDAQVVRLLAQAYLAGDRQPTLLAWLPTQLQQWPQDSDLRLLLGRAQLQAGQSAAAVATLEQGAPPLDRAPSYHALLAASYQQTGQWQASADLYRRLVALRADQPTWQLGLAIALEQVNQPALAARHYRLAQQAPGLDEGVRRFASERAAALGDH